MRKLILFFLLVLFQSLSFAQVTPEYYLPQNIKYNPAIPTPEQVLGHQVGEWHVTHDRLVYYFKELAKASDRIKIEEYGKTYEGRPLLLATITSPENIKNIRALQQDHLKISDPSLSSKLNITQMPAVVWMGFSVHGNEPSGTNASLLIAYYLTAAQGTGIDSLLANTIILMDPCTNPDGGNKFANWVNSNKSKNLNTDPASREFNEPWPSSRTNHYWFDLNRDWLPLQHVESQGRVKMFQEWKPNVLTDHHEMRSNSSFFFQPGVPSRVHPLTPVKNIELTKKIAAYHASALDKVGSFYFTEEIYDDFYYGKGSTYPDINGAVGILFEQASSRGHAQETANGVLTFPFTIKNQVTVAFSTLKAASALRAELLNYQREFYNSASDDAKGDIIKAYVFGSDSDAFRALDFIKILKAHQIKVHRLAKGIKAEGKEFSSETSYVVKLDQSQYKVIKTIFEKRTQFKDSVFYDISAWTFPLAFNLNYTELAGGTYNEGLLGKEVLTPDFPTGKVIGEKSEYAYLFKWDSYFAPRALNKIFENGLRVKVATSSFTTADGTVFGPGSILVPVPNQNKNPDEIFTLINELAKDNGLEIRGVSSGSTKSGADLGSTSYEPLQKPQILMIVGEGVESNEAGEIWHLLDQKFNMKLTIIEAERIGRVNIDKYNVVILPNGNFIGLNAPGDDKLKRWVQNGGVLIATQASVNYCINKGLSFAKFKKNPRADSLITRTYDQLENYRSAGQISGAIFQGKLDITHPLGFGYSNTGISLFRDNTFFLERSKNPFANPLIYSEKSLLSGYISRQNDKAISNSASIMVNNLGAGRVINISDNLNFRGFWYGTNKIFLNAIFFGQIISVEAGR